MSDNYAFADLSKRQYRGRTGYYIYPLSKIDKHYDKRGLEDHIYRVELNEQTTLTFVEDGYYAENVTLKDGKSLYSISTYEELDLTPSDSIVKQALLYSLQKDDDKLISPWFHYALEDKEFLYSYLETACTQEKFSCLNLLVYEACVKNFTIYLWPWAERYFSSNLTDWFFRYGIEYYHLPFCRLAIQNAINKDETLLDEWTEYIKELVLTRSEKDLPLCIQRVIDGGVKELFSSDFGDYFSPNYQISKLNAKELELAFQEAKCFSWNYSVLDEASFRGDISVLNFWLKKAIKYGKNFLPFSRALDNAAFKGNLEVLEFWSYASAVFKFPLTHTEKLLLYAILQKRVDVLYWWKKYSNKFLTKELVYELIKQNDLPMIKFLKGLNRTWPDMERKILFCSEEIVEYWKGK